MVRLSSYPFLARFFLLGVGFVLISAGIATAAFMRLSFSRQAGAEQALTGVKILLIGDQDRLDPRLTLAIANLRNSGFIVTSDSTSALSLANNQRIDAFFVTRGRLAEVPSTVWASLYSRGVLIGGIDVSLHELRPLVMPGQLAGSGWLKYTPSRPIFSLIYGRGCRQGAMSDWLDNWDDTIVQIVELRLQEIATAPIDDDECLLSPIRKGELR